MTDIVERLRNGICQDQYDEIEIYETEQMMREAAAEITRGGPPHGTR